MPADSLNLSEKSILNGRYRREFNRGIDGVKYALQLNIFYSGERKTERDDSSYQERFKVCFNSFD